MKNPRKDTAQNQHALRFFGALFGITAFLYLSASLGSEVLTRLLGLDTIPQTMGSNLGGTVGSVLAYGTRTLWGILSPVVPVAFLYIAYRSMRPKPWKRVTLVLGVGILCLGLLATSLSAFARWTDVDAHGWGGHMGDWAAGHLAHALGPWGAGLIPLALAMGVSATVVERAVLVRMARMARTAGMGLSSLIVRAVRILCSTLHAAFSKTCGLLHRGMRSIVGAWRERRKMKAAQRGERRPEPKTEAEDAELPHFLSDGPHSESASEGELLRDAVTEEDRQGEAVDVSPTLRSLPVLAPMRALPAPAAGAEWNVPIDLFQQAEQPFDPAAEAAEMDGIGKRLIDALAEFKVEASLRGWTSGPAVARLHVDPAPGVKQAKVEGLAGDLARRIRQAHVRVVTASEAGAVGIEVARETPRLVTFREMIEDPSFRGGRHILPIALGVDLEGKPVVQDLAKMPHLLIAGATGSGKSVCVNVILSSLIATHPPEDMRLILVDPKWVELGPYETLPHLRHKIINEADEAILALRWLAGEMERRYKLLNKAGVRNLVEYERYRTTWAPSTDDVEAEAPEKLPYLVAVIDEFADLMMTGDAKALEKAVAILAQKSRAVGIHLVLATQRPSVNIITGVIKANLPSRIAFSVASGVDSKTILDSTGAEDLLGNGDMLFIGPRSAEPVRIQGAFMSVEETNSLVEWAMAARPQMDEPGADEEDILEGGRKIAAEENGGSASGIIDAGDPSTREPEFDDAVRVCAEAAQGGGGGSTSLLQRKLGIGYGKAARIVDQLEAAGCLGPANGSKPREWLGYPEGWGQSA